MVRFWKLLPAAGLCAGLGLTMAVADGQPPEKERKGPPPGERRGPPPGDRPGPMGDRGDRRPEPKPDPQVDAWVKVLTDKMTDPHDVIRDSARAGIVAVGRAALPTLRKYADGDDGAKATAARRLMEAIEHGPRPPFGGGPGMPPPPFGRGGPGGPEGRPPFPPPPGGERPGDGDRPRGERPGRPERPEGLLQRPGGPGRPGGGPLEQALQEVTLNEKQQRQVKEIRESFEPKLREIFEQVRDGKLERPEAMEKRQKVQAELMKELKEALSAEQFEKLQEALKKVGPPMGRPGGPPGDRRPND